MLRDGDRHVLVGDQVLDAELAALLDDDRAALVRVLLADGLQLVEHDAHQQLFAREDRTQPLDGLQQLGELVDDLLPLEAGQPLQLHVEDRLRLQLATA